MQLMLAAVNYVEMIILDFWSGLVFLHYFKHKSSKMFGSVTLLDVAAVCVFFLFFSLPHQAYLFLF